MSTLSKMCALIPETGVRGLLLGGCAVLAIGFGGMTAWASLAPLHSAVSAAGALAPETGRKVVRHPDGGEIAEVLVREGARVEAGAVLLRLDSTEAATRLEMLTGSWLDALALKARLTAELLDHDAIEWPPELLERRDRDTAAAKVIENQQTLFEVRRTQMETEERLIEERVATLDREAVSLGEQRAFLTREIELITDDLRITADLLKRGNATRTKLVEQQKEEARLRGRDHELEADIARIRQQSVEARADVAKRRNDFREKVLVELEKARADAARFAEQIRDARNRLANRDIKAPDAGTVVMHANPVAGGMVAANEPILDIVPDSRDLLAEVRVQPRDIKSVFPDMPVEVTLTSYDSRVIGSLDGRVEYVSADRMTDAASRQDYYLVRIRLDGADPHQVKNLTIKPGMPVEARIILSARTPLDYLITPLANSYNKAFIQE
ncbi:HlyD family type I secretion periplasmic adaptor subunit [Azospirillum halopraeferens]|uniref:HlyD family type I secretion periplasmic adaptor subunit n=1 Tax=Azospirillum halopraeferens TaxID=34010 RepID=UPI000429C896|nr:HlyD family type I secretion periplasmic adaptor subunit [Azospirillum halopraeferens]